MNTKLDNRIHQLASVESKNVGEGTIIWQYSVILEGAIIGRNCNINCHTFIENDVTIGDRVTVKSGVHIWDGVRIGDDVFIGPSVVFTNDITPRSKKKVKFTNTHISDGASIGAGSIILAGVTIGKYALTGIGSVITKDVPDYGLVYGNPATLHGWVDENGQKLVDCGSYWRSVSGDVFQIINNKLIKKS